MIKHLKRFVAITISLVMAFQFSTNSLYTYAQTEDVVEPTQTEVSTESDSTATEQPVEPSETVEGVADTTTPPETGTDTTEPAPETGTTLETQPAEPQQEVAGTLKVEFVDANNAAVKESVEQALTSKYVGDTIRLEDLSIETNIEGYTLTQVKDKNDNTQVYTTETKDFVLTGNVTELQFVYTQNVQTDQPEGSEDSNAQQGGQEDSNSTQEQEEADDEDSNSQDDKEDVSEEETKEEELAYPEQILSVTASDGTIITIIAKEGALPEGAEVVVEPVESDSIAQIVEDALSQEGKDLQTYKAYNITILLDGEEIQPEVPIQVGITGSGISGTEKSLFHIADGSTTAEKVSAIDTGNTQTFSAEGFSIYVVAGTNYGNGTGDSRYNRYTMHDNQTLILSSNYQYNYNSTNWEITDGEEYIEILKIVSANSDSPSKCYIKAKDTVGSNAKATVKVGRGLTSEYFYITIEEGSFNITFNPNGGTGEEKNIVIDEQSHFTFPNPEDFGYTNGDKVFIGWSTTQNGSGDTYQAGVQYPNTEENEEGLTGDYTFYAIWLDTNKDDRNNVAYFYIRTDSVIQYEPAGYDVNSYYPKESATILEGRLKHAIAVNNNQSAVEANLAEQPSNQEIKSVLARYGVDFDPETQYIQWYVIKYRNQSDNTTYWNVDGVIRNNNTYKVTYNSNGGTTNVPGETTYFKDEVVNVNFTKKPSCEGYEFLGWDENPEAITPAYTENGTTTFTMPERNVTLYAIWREKDSVTIKYEAIGGGTVTCDSEALNPDTGEPEGSTAVETSGYKFVG